MRFQRRKVHGLPNLDQQLELQRLWFLQAAGHNTEIMELMNCDDSPEGLKPAQ